MYELRRTKDGLKVVKRYSVEWLATEPFRWRKRGIRIALVPRYNAGTASLFPPHIDKDKEN